MFIHNLYEDNSYLDISAPCNERYLLHRKVKYSLEYQILVQKCSNIDIYYSDTLILVFSTEKYLSIRTQ